MDEHRDGASIGPSQPHGGPGERTHRFVRWAVRHGRLLWLVAFALAVPSTVALVRLYKNLTSEVEELLPRNAPSVTAVEELRQRLPGLSTLGVVVTTSSPSELPAAERLIDDLAARVRAYPPELVRAVKTGTEAAAERRFLAAHLPLFVDLDNLVEVRRRVEARRRQTRSAPRVEPVSPRPTRPRRRDGLRPPLTQPPPLLVRANAYLAIGERAYLVNAVATRRTPRQQAWGR